jgi:flagellar protein FliO/FliZ
MNRLRFPERLRLRPLLFRTLAVLPALTVSAAHAAEAPAAAPSGSTAGSGFTMLLGLLVVLALMVALAWLFKRSGLVKGFGSNAVAKIIGGVSVGTRERVMVIEVADQWIVIGVAPGRVNTLATMPRQEHVTTPSDTAPPANFASWLKQTIDKRNGSS